jgi:Flp pilus assembly protein TadD
VGLGCSAGTKVNPRRSNTHAQLCKDYLGKKPPALEAAARECRESVKYDPKNWEAHFGLGMVEFAQVVKNFRLLEIDECTTGVDGEALRKEMSEHLGRAAAHFRDASKADPQAAEAWAMRGVVATQQERYGEAVRYLTEALAFPSRLIDVGLVRAHLGWAQFHLGKHVEAATALRQALQFKPKMCVPSYRLGRVYFARKEWEKAEAQFRSVASDASCRSQEAHLFLMKSLVAQKKPIDPALRSACVRLGPKSCIAAQCRTLEP